MEASAVHLPARWQLIATITRKELATILYHPYHFISLLIPLFVSFIFLFLIPTLDSLDGIEVVVFDAGHSELPTALQSVSELSVTVVEAETAVFQAINDEATVGLIIPAEFDTAVAANKSPEITIYLNSEARSSNVARAQRLLVEAISTLRNPAPAAHITWTEQQPESTIPGPVSTDTYLFTTLVLLSIAIIGCSILPHLLNEEQEHGALQALLASPATLFDLVMGKLLACLLLALLLASAVSFIHRGWQGHWQITAVAIFLCSFLILGIGMLFGLGQDKRSRGKSAASIAILVLSVPSWFAITPIDRLPDIVAFFLRLIPTQYFVTTLNYSLSGQPWRAVGGSLLTLTVYTAVIYLLIGWRLSRKPNVL